MPAWIWVREAATIWMSRIAMNWPITMPPKPRKILGQSTSPAASVTLAGAGAPATGGASGLRRDRSAGSRASSLMALASP